MRKGMKRFFCGTLTVLLLLSLCAIGAGEEGVEYDEDGGKWDYNQGVYTDPSGQTHSIVNDDDSRVDPVIHNEDGSVTYVGDDVVRNPDGSITVESGQMGTGELEEDNPNALTGDEAWARGMALAARRNGTYTPTAYRLGDCRWTRVEVAYMGTARSLISLDGEEMFVNTCDLSWETTAPDHQVLAVVKSQSAARLYPKPKTSNKKDKTAILDRVPPGYVLRVIKTEGSWTMVDYKGLRGYILTSSLALYANEPREYRTGWVATKSGHTTGTSTVHVRNVPGGSQQEEYRVGTPVTILDEDEKWCHVEVEGHMCYIQKDFVLYDEIGVQSALADGAR